VSSFYDIPCPTLVLNCIEDVIRDELRSALADPSKAQIGDVVGIAQSWWVDKDGARRDPVLGYWRVDDHQLYQPVPFRMLSDDQQSRLGRAAAHLLENIHARSTIEPEVLKMRRSPTGHFIDALHTADTVLIFEAEMQISQLKSNMNRGRIEDIALMTCKPKSQHERARLLETSNAFLRGVSGRFLRRTPGEDDYCLIARNL
jgi:hypothetical protein